MSLDIVVVMDPIASINPKKDSTFAMLLEAQRRGHRLHYAGPGDLAFRAGRAAVHSALVTVLVSRELSDGGLDRVKREQRWCRSTLSVQL